MPDWSERMMRAGPAAFAALLVLMLGVSPAAADVVRGGEALMVSGLVGEHAPTVSTANKVRLRRLMEGGMVSGSAFNVIAAQVFCRASSVDIASHTCELTFGSRIIRIWGRDAHELMATLTVAGMNPEGAAGSTYLGAANLRCRVEPSVIADHSGGGAECNWDPAP
jgi:hypothetical protein